MHCALCLPLPRNLANRYKDASYSEALLSPSPSPQETGEVFGNKIYPMDLTGEQTLPLL